MKNLQLYLSGIELIDYRFEKINRIPYAVGFVLKIEVKTKGSIKEVLHNSEHERVDRVKLLNGILSGKIPILANDNENTKLKEIEDIQEAIINAGGKFFRQEELMAMDLKGLLEILMPNNIKLKVSK